MNFFIFSYNIFYLLFSEQYACGTWKSQDLRCLSKKKKQWGESSMFRIHNSTITGSFFSFSWFFRILITRKCFCKLALVFAKLMSKKAFCVDVNAEANSYFIDLEQQNFGNKIYFSIIGKNLLAQIRSTWTFNFNF